LGHPVACSNPAIESVVAACYLFFWEPRLDM
jgi:hypothetical protein